MLWFPCHTEQWKGGVVMSTQQAMALTLAMVEATCGAAVHSYTNALIHEKSPYLLQHAHNPVDWHPWGEVAFKKARDEKKPIFLSVGYATCHWCHVMEEECFEDEEVAALLNRYYISVKVDREERPDIDDVYMSLARQLGSGGGWPLTVVMTPDQKPFFAATYIPKHGRRGLGGMMTLLPWLHEQLQEQSDFVTEAIARVELGLAAPPEPAGPPATEKPPDLAGASRRMQWVIDATSRGRGGGTQFPNSSQLLYLLAHARRTGDVSALAAVQSRLSDIRFGGIYDQIGGGIHRYTVDPIWFVPHFEKMLYNQAQLSMAATHYYALSGNQAARTMAEDIYAYVLRDLTSPEGAFYSAEDADSEGEEGVFYLWDYAELATHLSKPELALFESIYDVKKGGNWYDRTSDKDQPTNILRMTKEGQAAAAALSNAQRGQLKEMRQRLLTIRSKRPRPFLDDKILTDWNGLMIASMAEAGRLLDDPKLTEAARKAYAFIQTHLNDKELGLRHRWRDGDAAIPGMLADHAFLAWGAVALYRTTQDATYLTDACALMDRVLADFRNAAGGFNMTSSQSEKLLFTPSRYSDMAIPSGNSVALLVLTELASYTGQTRYETERARLNAAFVKGVPNAIDRRAISTMAMERDASDHIEVVIATDTADDSAIAPMLQAIQGAAGKQLIYLLLKTPENAASLATVAPFTRDHKAIDGAPTAYICRDFACRAPTTSPTEAAAQISAK